MLAFASLLQGCERRNKLRMPEPQPPIETATWYEVVLKQKYNDPQKLKSSLDSMYGQGRYKVKIKASRYILQLPEPPQELPL
ncbi:hypothetical protein F4815DRAFT_231384 [Daldinia loculata]|nr:hypothetical protein F4815DRAFT_231384 [Daldinia loculata]